ncbi:hypothetical protein BV22DRAFT_1135657 [Leucogyrophana mollusca]|uniref:Uncharacterized protein n=1 Tax=Leucogyrophana mollusca TaxID=85980 RepID=A0ACB8AV57_9AGAM|nr:hypothetical protein BV22DRAFT_1135657 [Leucogyrophana mollusca]
MITTLIPVLAYFGCTISASTIVAFVALIFQVFVFMTIATLRTGFQMDPRKCHDFEF